MAVKNFTKRKQSSKRKTRKQIKHRKQQGGDLKNMINSSKKTLLKMESELRSLVSALNIITNNGQAWHPDDKIVTSDDVEAVTSDIQLKENQILEVKKKIGEINSSYGSVSEIKNN
jgi:sugar-specific transcriptional regulator TrmB